MKEAWYHQVKLLSGEGMSGDEANSVLLPLACVVAEIISVPISLHRAPSAYFFCLFLICYPSLSISSLYLLSLLPKECSTTTGETHYATLFLDSDFQMVGDCLKNQHLLSADSWSKLYLVS